MMFALIFFFNEIKVAALISHLDQFILKWLNFNIQNEGQWFIQRASILNGLESLAIDWLMNADDTNDLNLIGKNITNLLLFWILWTKIKEAQPIKTEHLFNFKIKIQLNLHKNEFCIGCSWRVWWTMWFPLTRPPPPPLGIHYHHTLELLHKINEVVPFIDVVLSGM